MDGVAPSRGRGLKLVGWQSGEHECGRPFTGAWIETSLDRSYRNLCTVAPSRGRGLKLAITADKVAGGESPLHGGVD